MADEEKKIIIDEDWKAKAQKEKETLKQQEKAEAENETDQEHRALPPADFQGLIGMLATQAYFALGVLRHDENEEVEPDFEIAKYNIDLLGILDEKCKGNISSDEQKMLTGTLDQLRMLFVNLAQGQE